MIHYISNQTSIQDSSIKYITVEESLNALQQLEWISVDTETDGLDRFKHKILLLQLGNFDNQYVIDCSTVDILNYKSLLESKDLILQNAKFDLQFFYVLRIIPKKKIWDTMLAEQVMYNGLDPIANLAFLAKKYCKVVLDKTERSNIIKRGITFDSIIYGAKDIKHLEDIKTKQIIKAEEKDVLTAIKLENAFVPVLAYVEYCGIYLNKERWVKKYESAHIILAEKVKALDQWVINSKHQEFVERQLDIFTERDEEGNPIFNKTIINWASSKQVIPLFEAIGIDIKADNKSGKSIAEKIISKQKHNFEIIPLFLEYQTIKKDFTTYGKKFLNHINPITGRIHCEFKQLQATSRISSSNPNMQNLPADTRTRSCFTAEEGNILTDCDYKAQEDIIFVNNSKEDKMIEFYNLDDADGHSYVASLCFPKEIRDTPNKEVKKKFPKLRATAKKAKFSIHYGGTGYTIAKNLNLSEKEGDKIEAAYLKAFPKIHQYLTKVKNLAKQRKYILISHITGRKFWAKDYDNMTWKQQNHFHKLACNYPIQGQSAELAKIGAIYFFKWILEKEYFDIVKISNLVHDEVLAEHPISLTEEVGNNLKKCLEKGGEPYCKVVPLKADIEVSDYWVH